MKILEKLCKFLFDKEKRINFLAEKGLYNNMADEHYLKMQFKNVFGYELDLGNPQTFNEKLQYLKLYNRKDIYTTMVDKYEVKKYVEDIVGNDIIIPTLGVWESFDDIEFDNLPSSFVLKTTHDSGGIVICKDKKTFDKKIAKKLLEKSLKRNYYYIFREWPYKNVKPRIIAEEYIGEFDKNDIKDYKFFCFNGIPEILLICSERMTSNNMCKTWFDSNFKLLDIIENNHRVDSTIEKPINFDKMKEIAKKLSRDIPFVRVDLYEVNQKVYFGEITFFPSGGMEKFNSEKWNYEFGKKINLKIENNKIE